MRSSSAPRFEDLPFPACTRDREGRITWFNPPFTELTGRRAEDLIGRTSEEALDGCLPPVEGVSPPSMSPNLVRMPESASGGPVVRYASVIEDAGAALLLEVFVDPATLSVDVDPSDFQREREYLQRLIDTDSLTGALSRQTFSTRAPEVMGAAGGGLLMADLDDFKLFNDRYGHGAGDAALRHFVLVVRRVLRDTDVIARVGGEEFAILLPGAPPEKAIEVAHRIRAAVEDEPVPVGGERLPLTVSIGVRHDEGAEAFDLALWMRDADARLYAAKDQGRNCVVAFGHEKAIEAPSETEAFRAFYSEGPLRIGELRAATKLLRLVMDHVPQAIFWKDRTSVYLGCNRLFAARAGLADPSTVVGLTDYDLPWGETDAAGLIERDQQIMAGGEARIGVIERQATADGENTWLETNTVPILDDAGTVVGILGTSQDVTPRMSEVRELRDRLGEAPAAEPPLS